ncbi:hypothetical protein L6164_010950 [Bauhinia variegata]|uniref:Uncharacterized protein n=1 Tax=Bauhinia variegata TaxID=167791 RepID=A0ACB9P495_BAUVA|nr:hypothetical protein L6164_010950 [Bauhinia variegata]
MATTTTSLGGGGEDRVLATAQQIVKSLNTPKEVREDMLMIFSSFDNRLSNITDLVKSSDEEDLHRFEAAEKVILHWDASLSGEASRQSTSILDSPDDAEEYFSAVDEIIQWIEEISISPSGENNQILVDRTENAIQLAMLRLEDELRHVLIQNTVPLDAERLHGSVKRITLSFASTDGLIAENLESFGEVNDGGSQRFHERGASLDGDILVDLIHPDAVVELKEIADRMIRSGYEKECLQVYSSVRRDAFDECLVILGVEKESIEEIQTVAWTPLDVKMKNWVQAMKITVKVLLTGEKRLCNSIFGELDEIKEICFNDTAKGCLMRLLNFGEAIAIIKRSAEKLFRILDMYEALNDVMPELEKMVSDEFVISEARGVLNGLGEAAKGSFADIETRIRTDDPTKTSNTGDVHPMPRYVMNYLKLLVDYGEPADSLIQFSEDDLKRFENNYSGDSSYLGTMSPFGLSILFVISKLECNLDEKSKLYEDPAMRYVFMMNNIYYIVQKVKESDLRKVLGDDWIRKRRGQIRQNATGYLRAAWTKALSCLKDEGIGGSTGNASKMALKERFKNFNACFEEIYRNQTAWKVPDAQLREELRISISEKVIPAYRSFVGRFRGQLESGRNAGKYIKYSPEDLENYLLDLFEGSPGVLHHIRRKST